jgi:hypothetical protein
MRIILFIFVAAMLVGCAPHSSSRQATTDSGVLDAAKVLAIARDAIAANDTWIARAEFETPKRQSDDSWSVMVWRNPKTPGGFRLIA